MEFALNVHELPLLTVRNLGVNLPVSSSRNSGLPLNVTSPRGKGVDPDTDLQPG